MKWLKELYIGEKAQANARRMIRYAEKAKKSEFDRGCLVTLSTYPQAQLDIMSLAESRNGIYQDQTLTVLGIAGDREEAFGLVEQISRDCLSATGGQSIKAYFTAREADAWCGWRGVSV